MWGAAILSQPLAGAIFLTSGIAARVLGPGSRAASSLATRPWWPDAVSPHCCSVHTLDRALSPPTPFPLSSSAHPHPTQATLDSIRTYTTAVEAIKGCSTAQPLLLTTSLPPPLALAVLARCGLAPHPERLQLLPATSWCGSVAQAVSLAAARSTQLQLVTGSLAQLEQLAEGRVAWQQHGGGQGGAGGAAGASGGVKRASGVAGEEGGRRGDGAGLGDVCGGGAGRRGQGSGVGSGAGRAGSAGRRTDGGRELGCGTDRTVSVLGSQEGGRGAQVAVVGAPAGGLSRGTLSVEDAGRTGQLGASLDRQAAGRCGTQVQVRVAEQEVAQPSTVSSASRAPDGGNGDGTASAVAGAAVGSSRGGTGRAGDPWDALAVVHLAEWSCSSVSFRARALSYGPRAALLSEQQLAEVLRVMHLDVVMDGVAWR